MTDEQDLEALLEQSSLGTPGARRLRDRTPVERAAAVRRIIEANDEESPSDDQQPGAFRSASTPPAYQALREALEPIDRSFRDIANLYNMSAVRQLQEVAATNAELLRNLTRPLNLALIQAVHEQAARNNEIIQSICGPYRGIFNTAAWAQVGETLRSLQTDLAAQASAFRVPLPELRVFDFGTARIAADMSAALRAMGSAPFSASVLSPRTFEEAADALEEVGAAPSPEEADAVPGLLEPEEETQPECLPTELEQQVQMLASQVEEAVAATGRISRQTKRVIVTALLFAAYWEMYVLVPDGAHTVLDVVAMISLARAAGDKFYGKDE